MQKIKQRRWILYTIVGIYLVLSPFIGFPLIMKEAIYVVLGAVTLWLSVVESEDIR